MQFLVTTTFRPEKDTSSQRCIEVITEWKDGKLPQIIGREWIGHILPYGTELPHDDDDIEIGFLPKSFPSNLGMIGTNIP